MANSKLDDLKIVFNDFKRNTSYPNPQLDRYGGKWKLVYVTEKGEEIILPKGSGQRYTTSEMIAAIESFLFGAEYNQKQQ